MKRLVNKKAFTIMEMLIVVAIIAVLVAIAVPTFNGALTKSKEAADVANVRADYAQVTIDYLTGSDANFPTAADSLQTTLRTDLNYGDKLTVEATTAGSTDSWTIKYTADKLTNKDGGDTFEWTLSKYDIQ